VPTRHPIRSAVGRILRSRREEIGLTQEQVGSVADIHRNYIGSTERGERNVSVEALERWLVALHFSWQAFGRQLDAQMSRSVPKA
jgi:transcriptional regulator with XRE-family HTH domain